MPQCGILAHGAPADRAGIHARSEPLPQALSRADLRAGASRVVAFAVLKPKGVPQPIITVNDPEHILPLFVVHV